MVDDSRAEKIEAVPSRYGNLPIRILTHIYGASFASLYSDVDPLNTASVEKTLYSNLLSYHASGNNDIGVAIAEELLTSCSRPAYV